MTAEASVQIDARFLSLDSSSVHRFVIAATASSRLHGRCKTLFVWRSASATRRGDLPSEYSLKAAFSVSWSNSGFFSAGRIGGVSATGGIVGRFPATFIGSPRAAASSASSAARASSGCFATLAGICPAIWASNDRLCQEMTSAHPARFRDCSAITDSVMVRIMPGRRARTLRVTSSSLWCGTESFAVFDGSAGSLTRLRKLSSQMLSNLTLTTRASFSASRRSAVPSALTNSTLPRIAATSIGYRLRKL